jgi:hypothetical protein
MVSMAARQRFCFFAFYQGLVPCGVNDIHEIVDPALTHAFVGHEQ